jgi:sec-independent protein translocase protein TatC
MSEEKKSPDELAGTEQPFVQHLIELRDRLLYSVYGIGVLFSFWQFTPVPSALYDLLAMPLVKTLPEGARMIATGVVSRFWFPSR